MNYKRKERETNLKELPRPHQLAQYPSTKSVQRGLKVSQAYLPSVGNPSPLKVSEKGQHLKDTVCVPLANRHTPTRNNKKALAIQKHSSTIPYG